MATPSEDAYEAAWRVKQARRFLLVSMLVAMVAVLVLAGCGGSGDAAQRWCSKVHIGDSVPKLFLSVPRNFGLGPNAYAMMDGYWIPTGSSPYAGDGVSVHFVNGRVDWKQCG